MSLTKKENRLIELLVAKGFDEYTVVGFIISLKTEENIGELLDYLEKNDNASQDEVWRKLYDIRGEEMPDIEDEE